MGKILKWEIRIVIIFTILLILGLIVGTIDLYAERKDGDLRIPFTSEELMNEKMTTIRTILEDCGFSNISVSAVETDEYNKDGRIKVFEVDHLSEYDKDKFYPTASTKYGNKY